LFLLGIVAAYVHPTTCVIFGFSLMAAFGLHVLTSRFRFGAALDRDGPSLMSIGFGMIFGLVIGQVGIGLTLFASAIAALHRDGRGDWWRGRLNSVSPFLREFSGLLGWNYVRQGAVGILEFVPVMVLGHYRTVEAAGFYRLAANIVSVGKYVESAMMRVVYPVLSARAAKAGMEDMESLNATVKRWTLRGGCPMALLSSMAVLVLPTLVPWVFGQDYEAAVPSAQILMLGAAFSSIFFWLDAWYYAAKRVDFFTKGFVVYVGAVAIAVWLCVTSWGVIGVVSVLAVGRGVFVLTMAMLRTWSCRVGKARG